MLIDHIVEILEGLTAHESHNRKLTNLIYEGLNRMEESGMNRILYDTNDYDLTLKKDRDTGLDSDNIHILISPR